MKTFAMLALLVLSPIMASSAKADTLGYAVKGNGNNPIIHFTRLHHRVADVDDHQELSIFADGTVRVHTPVYMKEAGTFEYQLGHKDMQALLDQLDKNGLMSIDWTDVRAARDAAADARNRSLNGRFHVSDLTATHITLNFKSFGKAENKGQPVVSKIVWNDIPADARFFESNQDIQKLATIERSLLSLMDHSRRNAVRVAGGK